MKKSEVWLNPQEIQALLEGTLRWGDVNSDQTRSLNRSELRSKLLDEFIPEKQSIDKESADEELQGELAGKESLNEDLADREFVDEESQGELADKEFVKESVDEEFEEESSYRRLEGWPVIFLLGGVGLMTVCTWCYYVFLRL